MAAYSYPRRSFLDRVNDRLASLAVPPQERNVQADWTVGQRRGRHCVEKRRSNGTSHFGRAYANEQRSKWV